MIPPKTGIEKSGGKIVKIVAVNDAVRAGA